VCFCFTISPTAAQRQGHSDRHSVCHVSLSLFCCLCCCPVPVLSLLRQTETGQFACLSLTVSVAAAAASDAVSGSQAGTDSQRHTDSVRDSDRRHRTQGSRCCQLVRQSGTQDSDRRHRTASAADCVSVAVSDCLTASAAVLCRLTASVCLSLLLLFLEISDSICRRQQMLSVVNKE